jgi:hypothetical protein
MVRRIAFWSVGFFANLPISRSMKSAVKAATGWKPRTGSTCRMCRAYSLLVSFPRSVNSVDALNRWKRSLKQPSGSCGFTFFADGFAGWPGIDPTVTGANTGEAVGAATRSPPGLAAVASGAVRWASVALAAALAPAGSCSTSRFSRATRARNSALVGSSGSRTPVARW